jgi:HK97 family phage prohead protease
MQVKDLKLNIKEMGSDDGTFVGYASTYGGQPDSYGDIVDKGAFSRTLDHHAGKIKILYQHDQKAPIGMGELTDSEGGLIMKGKLLIGAGIPEADKAYTLLKAGLVDGLSIGYDIVKQERAADGNHLKELKLYEVSCVTLPANESCRIVNVKSIDDCFADVLERMNLILDQKAADSFTDAQKDQMKALVERLASYSPAPQKEAPTDSPSSTPEAQASEVALAEKSKSDSDNDSLVECKKIMDEMLSML